MRIKFIALILGVIFGGYTVVQYGPPELRQGILDLIERLGEPIGIGAEERPRPEERQADLTKKIETNLSSLERLLIIAEEERKKKSSGGSSTSTAEKPIGILKQLFGDKEQTTEEKIKIVVEETKKAARELQSVSQEINQALTGSAPASTTGNSQEVGGNLSAPSPLSEVIIRRSSSPEPQRTSEAIAPPMPTRLTDDQCRQFCGN